MSEIYGNWERLVAATLRREELMDIAMRTPSDLSSLSAASPSPSFNFNIAPFSLVGNSYTYHQILTATGFLNDETNLIKRGRSGDFYLGKLDSGILALVKRVDVSSFLSEVEIHGMLKHFRMIPLLGYCLENASDKFLVYKCMPNKDLSAFLRGNIDGDGHSTSQADWKIRLKIATGVAEGLHYLHHQCFPPLVHRDIQASSILLDDEFEVRLGSLSGVCCEEKGYNRNMIAKLLRLPKGFEQSESSASYTTCAYDVFCFGKVLLELISGKINIGSVHDSTMRDWVANTLQCVVPYDKTLITNIVDSSLIMDQNLLVQVWEVAFVAKMCLNPKPSKRPRLAEILKALEQIKSARLQGGIPTSMNIGILATSSTVKVFPSGEILSHPNLRIFSFLELKDATGNFGMENWLGQDEFGRIYQGLLHDRVMLSKGGVVMIAVKRMNLKIAQGFHQRQQSEVELLGRLHHPNILSPLGYCWEDNELLLVYEYLQKGSLKNFLFQSDSVVQPLAWDIRLKILLGAAKGVAFLHTAERRCLFQHKKERGGFYGYFKSSKILIDSDYNAKITGFGIGEVNPPDHAHEVHPLRYTSKVDEYAAPEYRNEGNSVLESDVYGFGVVLVRMLTGSEHCYPTEVAGLGHQKFIKEKMDPGLEGKYPLEAAREMAQLAGLCLQQDLKLRPGMKRVVYTLQDIQKYSM